VQTGRGNFTEQWFVVKCGHCQKEVQLSKGQHDSRMRRNKCGLVFCSHECKTKALKLADVNLTCGLCGVVFTISRANYNHRLKHNDSGVFFCSRLCASRHVAQSDMRRKAVTEKQSGVSAPQRGRVGHVVSEDTKLKISLKRRLRHEVCAFQPHWNKIHEELSKRGITKYASMDLIVPDAVFIEDGKLVAFELEHKRWFTEVKKKMMQYMNCTKYDKVILIWYDREDTFKGEWHFMDGDWKVITQN
jgi:hypothetical protein